MHGLGRRLFGRILVKEIEFNVIVIIFVGCLLSIRFLFTSDLSSRIYIRS